MKPTVLKFAVRVGVFALLTANTLAQSAEQWRVLQGPRGAEVLALFSQGQSLFAGTLYARFSACVPGDPS